MEDGIPGSIYYLQHLCASLRRICGGSAPRKESRAAALFPARLRKKQVLYALPPICSSSDMLLFPICSSSPYALLPHMLFLQYALLPHMFFFPICYSWSSGVGASSRQDQVGGVPELCAHSYYGAHTEHYVPRTLSAPDVEDPSEPADGAKRDAPASRLGQDELDRMSQGA